MRPVNTPLINRSAVVHNRRRERLSCWFLASPGVQNMPDADHVAKRTESVRCAILTVSDSRRSDTDHSGLAIKNLLANSGQKVCAYTILPDEPETVRARVAELCRDAQCQAVILTGGTGVATRDTTSEALDGLYEKRLDGFGELFRVLSYEQIGAAAMLSRASAGICNATVVFSLPGSTGAVRLGMEKLILPQLGHVVALLAGH